jgi:predicted AAA+ superfamily ATPase
MTMMSSRELPWVPRVLDLPKVLARKSHFLLGPRQTGKTSLLRAAFPEARVYDLLDSAVYLALSQRPERLGEEIGPKERLVVIDEVQRIPDLLNEAQRLIESRGIRFLLTGSSARKLRSGGMNLLGGRARVQYLHPLTRHELGDRFELSRALGRGLIPSIYFSDDAESDLAAYAGLYLQQEIAAEGVARSLPAFSRFLKVAALCNGTLLNMTNVANDAQVARTTVHEYFGILEDTLIVHRLPAWGKSEKRKAIATSKYYFFDVGVVGSLQGRPFRPGTPEFGQGFETWLHQELVAHRDYVSGQPLAYWRSTSGFEVDFILGDHTAVEAKASANVGPSDLRSLRALAEEKILKRFLCVSLERRRRVVDGITILPYQEFLDALWAGRFS